MERILVTGALGQIGSELVPALRARYGQDHVVASDIRLRRADAAPLAPPLELLDCTRGREIEAAVRRFRIDAVYHLAAILSADAEERPGVAWDVNMGSLYRVLEAARRHQLAVFFPSSIGAFGPSTPHDQTPQVTVQRPSTIYGITKVTGEMLCEYAHLRFGVDARGLRLPGLISPGALPTGGTTDYAVEIFHHAIRYGRYTCFLREDTRLEMMYMPDAVRAMMEIMAADAGPLEHRNAYNLAAMSFTPAELADEIRKHLPSFDMRYAVDPVRQSIADSWPRSIDDSAARSEWGWRPEYDLERMTAAMLACLSEPATTAREPGSGEG